jgi:hypothetical protein
MNAPPAPKRGYSQIYDYTTNEWEFVKKIKLLKCPSAPKKKYIQMYDSDTGMWEFVKI